jgi:hypothetical protein
MKRFLSILAFSLLLVTFVSAQGNGNGGNGNNGNGNGPGSGYSLGNGNGFNWLVNHLENGGQVPQLVALAAIYKARDWGWQYFRLTYGQMIAKYAQGQLTVSYISVAPPTLIFSVDYGGHGIVVILDNI